MVSSKTIGFIGAGNMATAIIGGLLANTFKADKIAVSDLSKIALSGLKARFNVNTYDNNEALINASDVVILAIKPQVIPKALPVLKTSFQKRRPLIISIAAGISLAKLDAYLGKGLAMVRAMPNTPALLQQGATALFANAEAGVEEKKISQEIINAIGLCLWLDKEEDINVVTALSGSGPAYFFLFIEAMITAAKNLGLSEEVAKQLCYKTALGSAMMAIESEVTVDVLRQQVTSPGGTTEAALKTFFDEDFVTIVEKAMLAAHNKSIELSQ